VAGARAAAIRHAVNRGWKYENGLLTKGRVKMRPSNLMPSKVGDLDYNPARDAFALRLGAVFDPNVPGHYRLGTLFLNGDGSCADPEACPECGSLHGEHRFFVRTLSKNPHAPPWKTAWTYCRRCTTPEEIEQLKTRALAAPNSRGGRQ